MWRIILVCKLSENLSVEIVLSRQIHYNCTPSILFRIHHSIIRYTEPSQYNFQFASPLMTLCYVVRTEYCQRMAQALRNYRGQSYSCVFL